MPEGVNPYPRWEGSLRRGPAMFTIAGQEVRRAVNNTWSRTALTVAFAYVVIYLGSLWTLKNARGDAAAHTFDNFLQFLGLLRWAALAVAATMAGPALLEDSRRGALELYLARAVTRADYLAGKVLAVVGLTWAAVSGPALLYYAASFMLFDVVPEKWHWVPLGALGYGLLWALVVAGAGLGLSCLARSSRAASILLFGGLATLDILVADILNIITRNETVQVVSPFSALHQQVVWLFGQDAPFAFPWWWGLVTLGAIGGLGWIAVALRHPRLPGVE